MTDMLNPDQFSGGAAGIPTTVNPVNSGGGSTSTGSLGDALSQSGLISASDVGNIDKMTQSPAPISGGPTQFPGPVGGGPITGGGGGLGGAVAGGSAAVDRPASSAGGAAAAGLGAI